MKVAAVYHGWVVAASAEAFANHYQASTLRELGVEQELDRMGQEVALFPTKRALGDDIPHSFGFASEPEFEYSFPSLLEHTEFVLADEVQNLHFECYHVAVASVAFEMPFDYCLSAVVHAASFAEALAVA